MYVYIYIYTVYTILVSLPSYLELDLRNLTDRKCVSLRDTSAGFQLVDRRVPTFTWFILAPPKLELPYGPESKVGFYIWTGI